MKKDSPLVGATETPSPAIKVEPPTVKPDATKPAPLPSSLNENKAAAPKETPLVPPKEGPASPPKNVNQSDLLVADPKADTLKAAPAGQTVSPPTPVISTPKETTPVQLAQNQFSKPDVIVPAPPSSPRNDERPAPTTPAQVTTPDKPRASAQIAVAVPSESTAFRWGFFTAGIGLIVAAAGLVFFLIRRRRVTRQPSLISRSMNRDEH